MNTERNGAGDELLTRELRAVLAEHSRHYVVPERKLAFSSAVHSRRQGNPRLTHPGGRAYAQLMRNAAAESQRFALPANFGQISPPDGIPNARRRRLSCTAIGPPLSLPRLRFLLAQQRAEPLNVAGHHRQRDITLEAVDAMIQAAVQAMYLQRIDGGFDGGVLMAQGDET